MIQLTYDTIQKIMNRIKLHETQESMVERMIDTNQPYLNRFKHVFKKVCITKGNKKPQWTSKNLMTNDC